MMFVKSFAMLQEHIRKHATIYQNGFSKMGSSLMPKKIQTALYDIIRTRFGLKSQMAISAIKTVVARYKTTKEQMKSNPYKYQGEDQ